MPRKPRATSTSSSRKRTSSTSSKLPKPTPENVDSLGFERRRIPRDPDLWTPRQREIVRAYIKAHPYDATWEGLTYRPVPDFSEWTPFQYDRSQEVLTWKLKVAALKRWAGVISDTQYWKYYKTIDRFRKLLKEQARDPEPKIRPGEDKGEFRRRMIDWSRRYHKRQDQMKKLYAELWGRNIKFDQRTGKATGTPLPEIKRLVMTPEDRKQWIEEKYHLNDKFSPLFYH